jgi:hypothetical protein
MSVLSSFYDHFYSTYDPHLISTSTYNNLMAFLQLSYDYLTTILPKSYDYRIIILTKKFYVLVSMLPSTHCIKLQKIKYFIEKNFGSGRSE